MRCYYCKTIQTRVDPRTIPNHWSINCRSKKNTYSAYNVLGIPNKYCTRCERKTHHYYHSYNNTEGASLYCN